MNPPNSFFHPKVLLCSYGFIYRENPGPVDSQWRTCAHISRYAWEFERSCMSLLHIHMYKKMNTGIGSASLLETFILILFPQICPLKKSGSNVLRSNCWCVRSSAYVRIGSAVLHSFCTKIRVGSTEFQWGGSRAQSEGCGRQCGECAKWATKRSVTWPTAIGQY